jgi:spermidine synthase
MLALVLGSSTHAFELMLSAFILGLAFGGLWVRRRIDATGDTMRLLGFVQLAMGIAAVATLPVYGGSFYVMQWLMKSLMPTEAGYAAFNVVSHAIALAVMFPAAYAANTAGSILGVLAAVHLGLPLLGVKGLIIAGAAIDLALAVVLLGAAPGRRRHAYVAGAVAVSLAAVVGAAFVVRLDAHHMASGVYRLGTLMNPNRYTLLRHEDGKTTTVSVTADGAVLSLRNNGKSDGSLNTDPAGQPTGDEFTMALLGALPIMMMPDARRVANIGFGTGLTAHAVLASERLERLDTIEIEPAVVRAAREFMPFNRRAFDDPRSHVHIEDAKTFFSSQQVRYDVIISEPSNPWVSGVASLFSGEFYRHARRHLKQGGLFVQWIQLYEFSPPLLASVIEALRPVFSDYVVWIANDGDLILVAANGGRVPEPQAEAFAEPDIAALLKRLRIGSLDELKLHRVGSRQIMDPYFRAFGAEANSDFFPVIDLNASKARFMRSRAIGPVQLTEAPLPLLDLFEPGHMPDPSQVASAEGSERIKRPLFVQQAAWVRDYLLHGRSEALAAMARRPAGELAMLRAALIECRVRLPAGVASSTMGDFARLVNSSLPSAQAVAVWEKLESSPCKSRLDASELRWLRLHAAIAAREASRIAAAAAVILGAEQELSSESRAFVLAALMAGHTLAGERGKAVKAFQEHRGKLRSSAEWQPIFTFLSAHALGSIGGTPSTESDNN